MLRHAGVAVVLGALLAAPVAAQRTDAVAVDTIVIDRDGQPIAGAEFADRWEFASGRWRGSMACAPADAKAPLRSDADGRLRGTWIRDPFATPLFGRSPNDRLVAVVAVTATVEHELVVRAPIVLRPAVVLRGEVKAPGAVWLFVRAVGAAADLPVGNQLQAGFTCDEPSFRLPLPPGTYQFSVHTGHSHVAARSVVLPEGGSEVDTGPITVPWQPFDLIGEVLPDWEIATTANIAPEQATLAALRGRPLLVVFDEWGSRARPAPELREGVAALGQLARRDEFRVVLFDTSTRVPGWPATQPDEPVVERVLPLLRPVPGKNAEALYGGNYAIVVLDRDGRLVHCGRTLPEAMSALLGLLSVPENGR